MGVTALIILIFIVPFLWLFWSMMGGKKGEIRTSRWKKPIVFLVVLTAASLAVNYHLSNLYGLSFFQNGLESIIGLIVAAAIFLIMATVNVIVSITMKNAPESVHNPKKVWVLAVVLCGITVFFTAWVYPFAEKTSYINKIETALDEAEKRQDEEDITVVFLNSERKCFRTSTSNCRSTPYSNTFFIKNNMDAKKEVQLQIRALGSKDTELKTVESEIMTLDAGELKLVETAETSDMESIWSRSSFKTDVRTYSAEWQYHYRDAE